jgi:exodeoxyribonuclease VII small subunit
MTETPDIPYEQARDELISVVQQLEVGGTSLDESLALWERGEHLAGVCQQWLDGARSRLAAAAGLTPEQDDQTRTNQDADSDAT